MKTLFLPAKSRLEIKEPEISEISRKLPKNIAIAYSVQYESQAKEIKKILSKNHNITKFTQVLGCSSPKFPKTDAVLLISDGRFHAISLAHETKLPIYIYRAKLEKISESEVKKFEQRQKASYMRFLNAKKVGILVSTKPGQQNFKKAIELKSKLKDKSSYILIGNNLNPAEFENFPEIQSYINTACPRLSYDSGKVVNISQL